jgi:hypothetical protein
MMKETDGARIAGWLTSSEPATTAVNEDCQAQLLYRACFEGLKLLKRHSKTSFPDVEPRFADALGNLYLWGNGFPGEKLQTISGRSTNLHIAILELLRGIGEISLQSLKYLTKHVLRTGPDTQAQDDLILSLVETKRLLAILETSNDDHSSTLEAEIQSEEDKDSEDEVLLTPHMFISELAKRLSIRTSSLLDLVPIMQTVFKHKKCTNANEKPAKPDQFQVYRPALSYVGKVRDRFPSGPTQLLERLGQANWQRHLTIRRKNEPVEIVMAEVPAQSIFHDSGLGSSTPSKYVSYAASDASHSSFMSMVDGDAPASRCPPTPREVLNGEPFECEICGKVQSRIKTRSHWK